MRDDILAYLQLVPSANVDLIAEDLGRYAPAVQEVMHRLDDDGFVIMRNGWYRLSEAARAGILPR